MQIRVNPKKKEIFSCPQKYYLNLYLNLMEILTLPSNMNKFYQLTKFWELKIV